MEIVLKTGDVRNGGLGDWVDHDTITVLDMGSWEYEFLVGLHELIEAQLCKKRGISPAVVDEFDSTFHGSGEPGDDPSCPYRREHQFATLIEMAVCHELGMSFPDYLSITSHIGELHEERKVPL